MKLKSLSIIAFAMAFTALLLNSCGDKTDDPPPATPAKTLNKSLLEGTSKKWYNQGSTTVHNFQPGGKYYSGGTWAWKSANSDTMIIDLDGSGSVDPPIEWKFYWSAEHEMACKQSGSGSGEILYKDAAW